MASSSPAHRNLGHRFLLLASKFSSRDAIPQDLVNGCSGSTADLAVRTQH